MEYVHRRKVPIYRLLLAFGIGLVSPCPLDIIIFSSIHPVSRAPKETTCHYDVFFTGCHVQSVNRLTAFLSLRGLSLIMTGLGFGCVTNCFNTIR